LTAINTKIFLAAFSFFVFFLAYYITSFIRNYSLRNNVIDVPNERSSHEIPTPTGGGLSISVSILLSVLLFSGGANNAISLTLSIGPAALVIAAVGWMDIHSEISTLKRAIIYLFASVWAVLALGGLDSVSIGSSRVELAWLGNVLVIISLAWLINLYNFMDGTDGLAGIQAISAGLFGAIFFMYTGDFNAATICLAILFSSLGFLIWNWASAKIFMGDVGSCTLGFTFGVLAIYGELSGSVPIYIWVILLSVFISDASFTLVKRILCRETWYRAHNTHAYQRLVQMGVGHDSVATYTFYTNTLILGPLAFFVLAKPEYALITISSVYFTLAVIWWSIHKRSINSSTNVT
jgi:Fuc2NAc and GlcNAc transferase